MKNTYSQHSSKTRRVNIQLPNYKYFHSPSKEDHVDKRFIGRERLISKFKSILENTTTQTGAYLITGYRGMGKSSYVGKVINEFASNRPHFNMIRLLYCMMVAFVFYIMLLLFVNNMGNHQSSLKILHDFAPLISSIFVIFSLYAISRNRANKNLVQKIIKIFKLRQYNHSSVLNSIQPQNLLKRRVVLKLNLGHEILNELDILSLIASNVYTEYRRFAYNMKRQWIFYTFKLILVVSIAVSLTKFGHIPNNIIKVKLAYNTYLPSQDTSIISNSCECTKRNSILACKEKFNGKSYAIFEDNYANADSKELIINTIDLYIDAGYVHLRNFISDFFLFGLKLPRRFNYIFLGYLLLTFISVNLISLVFFSFPNFSSTNRIGVLLKLKQLNENIRAVIQEDSSMESSINQKIKFTKSRSKKIPQAGVRQIEKDLIEALESMSRLTFPLVKPQWIIIFDELDKVDPQKNDAIDAKEEEVPGFESSTGGYQGGSTARIRKRNVLRLLANMKYFITTARAKFIFITGRELYDAFLADVSDREFTISSIFHEVIYVESFLSDDSDTNKKDITSMTEHYVCKFLLPNSYVQKLKQLNDWSELDNLTIKSYYDFLWEIKYPTITKSIQLKKRKKKNSYSAKKLKEIVIKRNNDEQYRREIDKVTMLLYQFVHYLTHVSNGAPKKITNFFEKYIYTYDYLFEKGKNSLNIHITKKNKRKLYLSFGYNDQCKIGFIHQLAHPIIQAIVSNVSNSSDKLLVSTSFLLDHLFKFHKNGFSWRNLEHAPEILEINRTPELRSFIKSILTFMQKTHMSSIVSGLYMFKFPNKISEEISIISKTSEEASALFNFTLDESLSVKRHYYKLLEYYSKRNSIKHGNSSTSNDFIHSIAGIQHILGDLKLLDEEYTEAIFEYQDSIQTISKDFCENNDTHQLSHMLFIMRTMLKMGLAFEKRKTFNSAYVTYSEIVSLLIDFRFIDEKMLGLSYGVEDTDDWTCRRIVLYSNDQTGNTSVKDYANEIEPPKINKDDLLFSINGEDVISKLSNITSKLKNKITSRLSFIDEERLLHQGLLARLFVLEKNQLGGITKSNLKVTENEFLNLHFATNISEKFLVAAEFFKKLADILYYKNGLISKTSCTLFNGLDFWGFDISNKIDDYLKKGELNSKYKNLFLAIKDSSIFDDLTIEDDRVKLGIIQNRNLIDFITKHPDCCDDSKDILNKIKIFLINNCLPSEINQDILKKVKTCNCRRKLHVQKGVVPPCYSCKYYSRSLKILAKSLLLKDKTDSSISKSLIYLEALDDESIFNSRRNDFFPTTASTLSSFGDVLISCSNEEDIIHEDFLNTLFNYTELVDHTNIRFESFTRDLSRNWHYPTQRVISSKSVVSDKYYLFYFFNSLKTEGKEESFEVLCKQFSPDAQVRNILTFPDRILKDEKRYEKDKEIIDFNRNLNGNITSETIEEFYKIHRPKEIDSSGNIKVSESWFKGYTFNTLTNIEKVILYYYASARYYKRSSNMKEAHTMYTKIMQLFLDYLFNKPSQREVIQKYLCKIEHYFLKSAIEFMYIAYDLVHVAEVQRLKWNSTVEMFENLQSGNLSVYSDTEEIFLVYFALQFQCNNFDDNSSLFTNLMQSSHFSPDRLCTSIYNRLIALKFKVLLNGELLKKLMPKYNISSDSYANDRAIRLIKSIQKIESDNIPFPKRKHGNPIELLEHLITDSIFCLQKFIETISPQSKTSLFTNSFMAQVYVDLYEWTFLFETLFKVYAYNDEDYRFFDSEKKNKIINDILKQRKNNNSNIDKVENIFISYSIEDEFSYLSKGLSRKWKISFKNKGEQFFNMLLGLIDKTNTHTVDSSYAIQMALEYFRKSRQMHSEGKVYKDMIEDMYFLDDDLNNDSLKFYLALERYRINSGKLNESVAKLKQLGFNSDLYTCLNYITEL